MTGLQRPTRRQFLKSLAIGTAVGIGGYAGLVEPNEVTVEERRLVLPRLPESYHGLRIAQLSDLHYGLLTPAHEIQKAVRQANALNPDLVAITGDLVTAPLGRNVSSRDYEQVETCARLLSGLHAPLGRFACLGNHDVSVDPWGVTQILERHGIHVVRNSTATVQRDRDRLWVVGVDDVLYAHADLDHTLARTPRNEFTILLAHEPDFADSAKNYPIDLQLSGHSHGGQIRFPLIGALYYPRLARKYPRGLYRVGDLHLYTNRGIGNIFLPARFLAPPEVTLLTLLSH